MKTTFTTDDRGVSEVIGAILVFGLLVLLMAIMQMQAVPAANQEVEFNHNQDVQSDLVKFHESSSRVASGGTSESTQIRMGTSYPSRMLFFNPPRPSGQLRVSGDQDGSIRNVSAVDAHVRDYIDGDIQNLEMRRLEYRPSYNEYDNAPTTVLEYGTVYRDFGGQITVDNPGQVINGNSISLTFYNGNFSRTSTGSMSLEAQATSAPARTVTVQPDGGPIVLELPTDLDETEWEKILGEEENVEEVRDGGSGKVEVVLNESKTYNLRMAQIGIGNGVPSPEAHYVTKSSNRQLKFGEPNRLPVEVRDRYNNPVSGETLYLNVSNGQFQNGQQSIVTNTTEDGLPSAVYTGSGAGVVQVEASFVNDPSDPASGFNPNNPEDARFNVSFDPRHDDIPPTVQKADLTVEDYSVCSSFTDIILLGNTITSCVTTSTVSQLVVDYNVTDTGGAGLDYLELVVYDSSGNVLFTTTESLQGAQADGVFRSPQINHDASGTPDQVDVRVFDRNGKRETENDI